MNFEERLDRLAELIVKTNDENAAWIVLSIECDEVAANALISDLMYGTIDKTAEKLYSMYALSGVSFESIAKAITWIKDEYMARKLPTNISPDTMLTTQQIYNYLEEEGLQ